MLQPYQKELLRSALEHGIGRLERSTDQSRRAGDPVPLDQTSVGRLSRIDAIQNQHISKGLEERERVKLAEMLEAVRRLDDGSYGRCATCAEWIPFARLEVFPETVRCASCAIA